MASIAMLIRGALANALAFTGSSYVICSIDYLQTTSVLKERGMMQQALQKAQIEWALKHQERIDFINKQLRLERKAETKFTELNEAMREYHEVFGHELPPLPREPILSNFYTLTAEQHYRELGFIALRMIEIGRVLYYLES